MHMPLRPACVLAGTGPGGQPHPTALQAGSLLSFTPQADSRNSTGYCDDKSSPTARCFSWSGSPPAPPPRSPKLLHGVHLGSGTPVLGRGPRRPQPPHSGLASPGLLLSCPRLLLTLPMCPGAPAPPPLGRASAACHTPHGLPLRLEALAGPGPLAPAEHSGM
ncbi:hypothetical protein VULLAG_LOCUS1636 [Vulpes lagopus]